jgi:hypothetical protein
MIDSWQDVVAFLDNPVPDDIDPETIASAKKAIPKYFELPPPTFYGMHGSEFWLEWHSGEDMRLLRVVGKNVRFTHFGAPSLGNPTQVKFREVFTVDD